MCGANVADRIVPVRALCCFALYGCCAAWNCVVTDHERHMGGAPNTPQGGVLSYARSMWYAGF